MNFDKERLARVTERIAQDIDAERYDGARLLVAHRGETVLDATLGFAHRETRREMRPDSVFSIMSITKVMTAVTVMQAMERGDLSLMTPVAQVIPEFAQFGKERVTVYQLLTHTAGMGMGAAPLPVDQLGDLRKCAAAICALPLDSPPGELVSYSASMGFTILAEMVRRLDREQREFRDILEQDVFVPLGMKDTAMGLAPRLAERRVPVVVRDTHAPELNPKFQADRDAAATAISELPSGGASFASAPDILRFGEAFRRGGALEGGRILSPATIDLMRQNQTGDRPSTMMNPSRAIHGMAPFPAFLGLGLFLRGTGVFPSHMPLLASSETFGGWGLGSMAFWVDPRRELTFVMLTAGVMERISNLLRFQRVGDMVISSIVDPV